MKNISIRLAGLLVLSMALLAPAHAVRIKEVAG